MNPIVALFLAWAFNASWPIVGQKALVYFDPLTFSLLSLGTGWLTLVPFLLRRGTFHRLFEPGLRGRLFLMGAIGSGVTNLLFLYAVSKTTASNAAIVCQVEVVYSAVMAAFLLKEKITAGHIAAGGLVLAGTGIILAKDLGTPHWEGDLVLLATPWMFQLSHIVSKKLPKDIEYSTIAAGRMFYGAMTILPAGLLWWAMGSPRIDVNPQSLGILGWQAVFLGSWNLVLWYNAIRNLELGKATAVMLSYPALTMVFAWVLGNEAVGLHQVAGLVLSMTGAIWLTLQMKPSLPAGEVAPA